MDDIEHSRLESGEHPSPLPRRDDDLLLERLKNEPPAKPQAPATLTAGIVIAVVALGVILFFLFRNPEVFVQQPPPGSGARQDASELVNKRMRLGGKLDSLEAIVKANPEDHDAMLALANTYYDGEYWDRAMMAYEHYLGNKPKNVNARIDYAFAIAQATGDFKLAISEIDTGLVIEPDHVQGLFNAGLLSLRANVDNKQEALRSARSYFARAKAAAAKQGNTVMSGQIDEILKEMEKAQSKP